MTERGAANQYESFLQAEVILLLGVSAKWYALRLFISTSKIPLRSKLMQVELGILKAVSENREGKKFPSHASPLCALASENKCELGVIDRLHCFG